MKVSFKLSPIVAAMIAAGARDAITQACEAEINRRKLVESASDGMKHVKADNLARSSAHVTFEQVHSVVTAFVMFSESEVGAVDRQYAKLAKLVMDGANTKGGTVDLVKGAAIAKTFDLSFPASYKGHDIAGWVRKIEETAKAKTPKQDKQPAPAAPAAPVAS